MNKETRQFIWGLILIFINGISLVKMILYMLNGDYGVITIILALFNLFGAISGGILINKTT